MSIVTRLLGLILFCGSLAVVYLYETSSSAAGFLRILHWPAMVLTGIGPVGLTMICFDASVLGVTVKLCFGKSGTGRQKRLHNEAELLNNLGKEYYAKGANVFESADVGRVSDFVKVTLERMSVRMPTKDILELLEVERERRRTKIISAMNVVGLAKGLAPSIGMLGTILGMVSLLSSLEDPSHLGKHMSLALLTTFFGLFFSLVIWTPLHQKLERVMDLELESYDQALIWLEILEKRKPVNYFAATADLDTDQAERRAA